MTDGKCILLVLQEEMIKEVWVAAVAVVGEWVAEDPGASAGAEVDPVWAVAEVVLVVAEVHPEEWAVGVEEAQVLEVEAEALVGLVKREVLDNLEDNKVVKVDLEEKGLGLIMAGSQQMDSVKGMFKYV